MELDPNVFTWNIAMVCEWLSCSNLSHLSPTFQANEVDGPTLLSLTPDDIRDELHIKSLGDRKRVKEAIEKLLFSIDFVDQRVSLNLMVVDAREYAEQHEVYERGGEDANVAVVEQMRELNKLEDVIESGMAAFECENMEMKTEADYNEAQHLSGMFETLRYALPLPLPRLPLLPMLLLSIIHLAPPPIDAIIVFKSFGTTTWQGHKVECNRCLLQVHYSIILHM